MSEALKPCPLCHSSKVTLFHEQVAEDCMMSWVECASCGLRSKEYETPMGCDDPAISWNTRPTHDALVGALKPFAEFADKFEANPLGNAGDILYAIHTGELGAEFRLSDCIKARSALKQAGALK